MVAQLHETTRRSHQPREVNGGPLLENVFEGKDIDIQKIPTPIWHEHDGGPYIGTGCMVVMLRSGFRLAQLRLFIACKATSPTWPR